MAFRIIWKDCVKKSLTVSNVKDISNINPKLYVQAQCYSQYGPHFISPIYNEQKQRELFQSGEASKLAHIPIKAARNNENSFVYHDPLVMKFTNYVMRKGNKQLARQLVENTFENIKRIQLERYNKAKDPEEKAKIEVNPLKIFYAAVENSKPLLKLTPIKRGGSTYQVPVSIKDTESLFRAMNWLIEAGKEKDASVRWSLKMAYELIDAANNTGRVIKKKIELYRQCEANKAYAHYRWG